MVGKVRRVLSSVLYYVLTALFMLKLLVFGDEEMDRLFFGLDSE